jgi:hypothetical protein
MRIYALIVVTAACTTRDPDPEFYGRPWVLTAASADVPSTQANGAAWDFDNSPPDPYAQIYLDGTLLGATPTIDDTYAPTWNYSFPPIVINEGSSVSIDLFDSDDLDDDTIFRGCEVDLDSHFVKQGDTECHSFTLSVSVI